MPVSLIDYTVTTRESRMSRLSWGDPLESFGAERRCEADDCGARLSRYNPGRTCGVHRGWSEEPGRRTRG